MVWGRKQQEACEPCPLAESLQAECGQIMNPCVAYVNCQDSFLSVGKGRSLKVVVVSLNPISPFGEPEHVLRYLGAYTADIPPSLTTRVVIGTDPSVRAMTTALAPGAGTRVAHQLCTRRLHTAAGTSATRAAEQTANLQPTLSRQAQTLLEIASRRLFRLAELSRLRLPCEHSSARIKPRLFFWHAMWHGIGENSIEKMSKRMSTASRMAFDC